MKPVPDATDSSADLIPPRFWAWAWPLLAASIALEITVRTLDWFKTYPWIDNPMHFLWGANVFWICLWLFRCRPGKALLLVLVWQILWEAGEMIGDRMIAQPAYMIDNLWPDGVQDTLMDLLGAALLWWTWRRVHRIALPLPPRAPGRCRV